MHHRERGQPAGNRSGFQRFGLAGREISDNARLARGQPLAAGTRAERGVAGEVVGQRLDAGRRAPRGSCGRRAGRLSRRRAPARPAAGELGDAIDRAATAAAGQRRRTGRTRRGGRARVAHDDEFPRWRRLGRANARVRRFGRTDGHQTRHSRSRGPRHYR